MLLVDCFYLKCFQKALNLPHEFLYDNSKKKIKLNFNKKKLCYFLVKKNSCLKLMHFQDKIVHLNFLQKEALRSEIINK